jgi:hypothetical protein
MRHARNFDAQQQYDLNHYPVVFIGTKMDQGEVHQVRGSIIVCFIPGERHSTR